MPDFITLSDIRNDISKNLLDSALHKLEALLKGSSLLNGVIQQSGRFNAIQQQFRLGTVNQEQSTLTINQIRTAILELVDEIEKLGEADEQIKKEIIGQIKIKQKANKIYNIHQIDKADFS